MSVADIKEWVDRVAFPTADDDSPGDRIKVALLTAVEALERVTDARIDVLVKEVIARDVLASIRKTLGIEQETKT